MPISNVLNELVVKKDNISTTYKLGTVNGYYNAIDEKFYEESTYATEIEGTPNLVYIDINENTLYIWKSSTSSFVKISGGGTPDWDNVLNKPFSDIGDGLNVKYTGNPNGNLVADVQSVALYTSGTASSTGVRKTELEVGGASAPSYYTVTGSQYMEQTLVTSTSTDTTYTFTNAAITTDSVIDVYASWFGITPSYMSITNGQCVVTIPKQSSAFSLGIRIYIK